MLMLKPSYLRSSAPTPILLDTCPWNPCTNTVLAQALPSTGSSANMITRHRLWRRGCLARNPEVVEAMLNADWDIARHGYRWLDYQFVKEAIERAHNEQAIELHTKIDPNPLAGTRDDSPKRVACSWSMTTSLRL